MTRDKIQKIQFTKNERLRVSERARQYGYRKDAQFVREAALGVLQSGPKDMELRALIRMANALQYMARALSNARTRRGCRSVLTSTRNPDRFMVPPKAFEISVL